MSNTANKTAVTNDNRSVAKFHPQSLHVLWNKGHLNARAFCSLGGEQRLDAWDCFPEAEAFDLILVAAPDLYVRSHLATGRSLRIFIARLSNTMASKQQGPLSGRSGKRFLEFRSRCSTRILFRSLHGYAIQPPPHTHTHPIPIP